MKIIVSAAGFGALKLPSLAYSLGKESKKTKNKKNQYTRLQHLKHETGKVLHLGRENQMQRYKMDGGFVRRIWVSR